MFFVILIKEIPLGGKAILRYVDISPKRGKLWLVQGLSRRTKRPPCVRGAGARKRDWRVDGRSQRVTAGFNPGTIPLDLPVANPAPSLHKGAGLVCTDFKPRKKEKATE